MKRIERFWVPVMAMMIGLSAWAGDVRENLPVAWQVAHQAGQAAMAQSQYQSAEAAYFNALMEAQKYVDAGHPEGAGLLARSYNDLGVVFHAQGQLEKAEAYFEKALKLWGHDPGLKVSLVNLAGIYQEQGRLDDMEALIESYRPTQTTTLSGDTEIPLSVYELANRFMLKGQFDDAARMYKKLLSWMPLKPEPGNALFALRPDILRRLADIGQPVMDAAAVDANAMMSVQQESPAVVGEHPISLKEMLPTPLPNDAVFRGFISQLDQKVKARWSPPDYYRHIAVTVLMVLNKKGELMEYHLKESSGFHAADQAALGAVRAAAPFMPFPKQYSRDYLVVEFNFNE